MSMEIKRSTVTAFSITTQAATGSRITVKSQEERPEHIEAGQAAREHQHNPDRHAAHGTGEGRGNYLVL